MATPSEIKMRKSLNEFYRVTTRIVMGCAINIFTDWSPCIRLVTLYTVIRFYPECTVISLDES